MLGRNNRWQDDKTDIQESLSYMYKHTIFEDLTIQTTNDEGLSMCFCAHKLILATRSPVFADMFYNGSHNSNIISLNISPRVLDILLWYIYSDYIEVDTIEELLETFDAAVHYKVSGFSKSCIEKLLNLSSNLNASNLCSVIKIACHSKSEELLNECIQFIVKEPENSIRLEALESVNEETFLKILKALKDVSPKIVLKAVIKWMMGNNLSDRRFLSVIDFALFNSDEFLNIVEEFPYFFSEEEIRCILQNLLLPETSELPPWCKFSKKKERCIKISLPSQYEAMEIIKESAMKIETVCCQKFSKVCFYSLHCFQQDLLLKINLQSHAFHLVMMELAFGSDYVPADNLKVELRSNVGTGRKMQPIKHYLLSSRAHYYLLLCNKTMPETGNNFNLLLNVDVAGLEKCSLDGAVSNQRYRTASVSNCDSINLSTHCNLDIAPSVSLIPFSECLLLVDPKCGEKKFIISTLYFDNPKNIRKYMTFLEN